MQHMPSVCFYFQVHQPYRIKPYPFAAIGRDHSYFNDALNREVIERVSRRCYLPTNERLLKLIEETGGEFKVAFSITGTAIEQMRSVCPEALDSFKRLAATGCVEFLGETYYHSLASLYDAEEFKIQVAMHSDLMRQEFGYRPRTFRNTELLYDDSIGDLAASLGFTAILAEGVDSVLGWRSPNFVYRVPRRDTRLLVKNYRFSDDIAFRFSSRTWSEYPLTADKFAGWICELAGNGDVVDLFLDYETFGEHQWEETGIFRFLEELPRAVLSTGFCDFVTPAEAVERYTPLGELSYPRLTSWADLARDASAWRGNKMQNSALRQIYEKGSFGTAADVWRKLQTSDHFYYMSTKSHGDGQVHSYFSPFESPYDAFIAYMNVLRDFREVVTASSVGQVPEVSIAD
jgi:alpha-amylase